MLDSILPCVDCESYRMMTFGAHRFCTYANSLVLLFAAAAQPKHLQSSMPMSYCPMELQPIRSVWLVRVNWFAMRSKCSTERPPIGSAAPDNSMARNGNWSAGPTARQHSLTSICPYIHSSLYLSLFLCPDAANNRSPIAVRPRRMAQRWIDRQALFARCGPLAFWRLHVYRARHTTSGGQDPAKQIHFLPLHRMAIGVLNGRSLLTAMKNPIEKNLIVRM